MPVYFIRLANLRYGYHNLEEFICSLPSYQGRLVIESYGVLSMGIGCFIRNPGQGLFPGTVRAFSIFDVRDAQKKNVFCLLFLDIVARIHYLYARIETVDYVIEELLITAELNALIITAASIAFFHTILGPDHYLPFIMMSWARKWSAVKTTLITFLCGLGHICSSVVLGLIGVSLGLAVKKLEIVESVRGNLAAWLLIAFGLVYIVWGLRRVYQKQPHTHSHIHASEAMHTHSHLREHTHVHNDKAAVSIAPWTLFVIFVFGPCEPLIPILMYPAAQNSWFGLVVVTCVFGIITIATMLGTVLLSRAGVNFLPLAGMQRFSHVIAGATICLCGLAIVFLGL